LGRLKLKEETIAKKWAKKHLAQDKSEAETIRNGLGLNGKQVVSKQQMIEHVGKKRIRQKV
jgi:hypothetical protein